MQSLSSFLHARDLSQGQGRGSVHLCPGCDGCRRARGPRQGLLARYFSRGRRKKHLRSSRDRCIKRLRGNG
jgi:hypothetical protein